MQGFRFVAHKTGGLPPQTPQTSFGWTSSALDTRSLFPFQNNLGEWYWVQLTPKTKGELGMQRTDADLNSYERRQKELIGLTTAGGHS